MHAHSPGLLSKTRRPWLLQDYFVHSVVFHPRRNDDVTVPGLVARRFRCAVPSLLTSLYCTLQPLSASNTACPTTFRDLSACASFLVSIQIFTPAVMPEVIAMVKANICRALPPQPDDCDPDKDEPLLEEAWPHLQVRENTVLVQAQSTGIVVVGGGGKRAVVLQA